MNEIEQLLDEDSSSSDPVPADPEPEQPKRRGTLLASEIYDDDACDFSADDDPNSDWFAQAYAAQGMARDDVLDEVMEKERQRKRKHADMEEAAKAAEL
eukprot:COSAG01_NODE_28635_length_656_cov_1.337522_2_plen_99_part_00